MSHYVTGRSVISRSVCVSWRVFWRITPRFQWIPLSWTVSANIYIYHVHVHVPFQIKLSNSAAQGVYSLSTSITQFSWIIQVYYRTSNNWTTYNWMTKDWTTKTNVTEQLMTEQLIITTNIQKIWQFNIIGKICLLNNKNIIIRVRLGKRYGSACILG